MIKLGTPIYEVERQQWNYGRLFEAAAAASRVTKVLYCRYRSTGGTVAWWAPAALFAAAAGHQD